MLFLARNQWDKKGEMAMDQTIPHTFSRICLENNAHLSASVVVNDGGIKRNEGLIFLTIIKRKLWLIGKIYGVAANSSRRRGEKGAKTISYMHSVRNSHPGMLRLSFTPQWVVISKSNYKLQ